MNFREGFVFLPYCAHKDSTMRVICLFALVVGALALPQVEERKELISVNTTTLDQVKLLASFQDDVTLDFWNHPLLNQLTTVLIPASRHDELMAQWIAAGMIVILREHNIQDMIDRVEAENERYHNDVKAGRVNNPYPGLLLDHSRYYRDMLPNLRVLRDNYPSLVFFDESGNTPPRARSEFDGRINHVIELGANRGSTPVIMLEVNIHAREHITAAANLYFMDWVLKAYGQNDPDARFLLDNYHFVIMPVANPDGYDYSYSSSTSSIRLWRKNRKVNSGSTCRGVDLNRNFDANWSDPGNSNNPCSDTYRGPTVGSEAEAIAVMQVFNAYRNNMVVFMPVHCFSQLLLLPYSYSSNPNAANAKPPNSAKHYAAAQAMSNAMRAATNRYYTWGLAVESIGYNAFGTSGDWSLRQKSNMLSIAYELQPDRNVISSTAGFIRPASEIVSTGKEYAASLVALGRYVQANGV